MTAELKLEEELEEKHPEKKEGLNEAEPEEELTELAKAEGVPELKEAPKQDLDPAKVVEAALFLANKPLSFKQLASISNLSPEQAKKHAVSLAPEFAARAFELVVSEEAAFLQVRPQYLGSVSSLSKEVEMSRKARKILALVAKKGQLLQSDLKHYFRGEIYEYVTELKELGYVESKKSGKTRILRPTTKFNENFQVGT